MTLYFTFAVIFILFNCRQNKKYALTFTLICMRTHYIILIVYEYIYIYISVARPRPPTPSPLVTLTVTLDLDLDSYIAGAILITELGEYKLQKYNANKTYTLKGVMCTVCYCTVDLI